MEKTNDGKRGGWLVGKRHYDKSGKPIGGIPAVVGDSKRPVELEGGEVIINREASKKYWRELSKINQSAGNGVPIKPQDVGADEDPEEYKDGGKVIDFNPNHLPNRRIYNYANSIKKDYPEIWGLGGNIFGNEAFKNLQRVIKRGYWTENEEWMYIKWRSYVARHKHDFRIEGVIAMLKWVDKVDKGWEYMKNLIEEEIEKRKPKKKRGGSVNDEKGNVKFMEWYIGWYKKISDKMNILFSLPNVLLPFKEENVIILDLFEKIDQNIDAKPYLKEIANKADQYGVTIYLEPIPRYKYFLKNIEKRKKVSKDYLISYYKKFGFEVTPDNNFMKRLPKSNLKDIDGEPMKKGGAVTYKNKYNKKYGYKENESHDLDEISEDTGVSGKGLRQIYNKGVGAYKTNPESVRPNVKSKEQWAMGRVYSAVMGGKAARIDAKELKMEHGGKVKQDKSGNFIGEGDWHVEYNTIDFSDYPQISHSISKSQTTESVYVTYKNNDNYKTITLRFSNHQNNAVKFGDQLDGNTAKKAEVLYHLGLAKRTFIPDKYLYIESQAIAKKNLSKYPVADKTIQEMYQLGAWADISEYKGKIAKDSNYLILGDTVKEKVNETINSFGQKVTRGSYDYEIIDSKELKMEHGGGFEFIPEKKGTLIRGNEIIKYFEKVNGNYRLLFYTLDESRGKVPTMCDAFGYCSQLNPNDVTPQELINLIKKNQLMEHGGNIELTKGIKTEQEHKDTLEKIASGEITVDQAIKMTAQDHLKENPKYYTELSKIEKFNNGGNVSIYNGDIIRAKTITVSPENYELNFYVRLASSDTELILINFLDSSVYKCVIGKDITDVRVLYSASGVKAPIVKKEPEKEEKTRKQKTTQPTQPTQAEQAPIPSTDPSTWGGTFNVGDKVKIRIDMISIQKIDYNSADNEFTILSINRSGAYPFQLDSKGNNVGGFMRPENPSGVLYLLDKNGGNWEGKDLELIEKAIVKPKQVQEKLTPINVDFMGFLNNFVNNEFQNAQQVNSQNMKQILVSDLLNELKQQKDNTLNPYIKYISGVKID